MKQVRFAAKPDAWLFLLLLVLIIGSSCGRLPRSNTAARAVHTTQAAVQLNLNTASARELEQLPGVGKVVAERIVAYREQYGSFRRPAELLMVNGVSDKKFRAIQGLIVVE
ncbi:MAG: helix-hairpin-helix domain-containing protein [bacterium]